MRDRQLRAAGRVGTGAGEIAKELRSLQSNGGHNLYRLWEDWISSMALAIVNGCDKRPEIWERREAEYMAIVKRHGADTMKIYNKMFHMLVDALENNPTDVLGGVYMALELGSDRAGQFFTPVPLCELMVAITMDDDYLREQVQRNGFVTMNEPAIGGGAMVVPIVGRMLAAGLNPSEHLHVTGQDIDPTPLRMSYVQLSLLGVPGEFWVGDTLRMEMREVYYTPIHIMLGWDQKLRSQRMVNTMRELLGSVQTLVEQVATDTSEETEPMPDMPELGFTAADDPELDAEIADAVQQQLAAQLLGTADVSDCGCYRYSLTRPLATGAGRVVWIMLNPSTADALKNDPTIVRCLGFTARLGFAEMMVVNLFAWRSTDPQGLRTAEDPIGPRNDQEILRACEGAELVILAWGVHGDLHGRDREVRLLLARTGINAVCLGTTKANHPRHPLMLRADAGVQAAPELA
jgi:hypothetical protein